MLWKAGFGAVLVNVKC